MTTMRRPCLGCGVLTRSSRCRRCSAKFDRTRDKPTRRGYDWAEVQRRAAAVKAHRAQFGDWCPGWQRPPHDATDLTADHIVPVANPNGCQ